MSLAQIDQYPDMLTQRGGNPDLLAAELVHTIGQAIRNHPRSLQRRIGPSEIGCPCPRRIAYKLLDHPVVNTGQDAPWLPTIGTAVHAWLENVFTYANPHNDPLRWLTELPVSVGSIGGVDITGSVDLYDRVTATVVDWKIVGPTTLKKYRTSGPGMQYRAQAHLYGRGLTRRGCPVDTVMLAFLPRNGELTQAHIWHEPYDEQVALDALQRAEGISLATQLAGPAVLPDLPTVEAYCTRCPWYRHGSKDPTVACPGAPSTWPHDPQPFADLLGGKEAPHA